MLLLVEQQRTCIGFEMKLLLQTITFLLLVTSAIICIYSVKVSIDYTSEALLNGSSNT